MNEDALFDMVNEAIIYAKAQIEEKGELIPFAMALDEAGEIRSFNCKEKEADMCYSSLLDMLRREVVHHSDITALAVLSDVSIPAEYHAGSEYGIRVHLEERHKRGNRIGARFLYVPYTRYKEAQTGQEILQLHAPLPVAFPPEIFV